MKTKETAPYPPLSTVGKLALWIEEQREKWLAAGYGLLEEQGRTLWCHLGPDGEVMTPLFVYVGSAEACTRPVRLSEEFTLINLGNYSDIVLDDAKAKILEAVGIHAETQ